MNRFFEFSPAQMKMLTVLAIITILTGSYKFVRDFYLRPSTPVRPWRVEVIPASHSALLLNLNSAPADSLELIPGIGPALAQRIIDYRQKHGVFVAVDSLVNIYGIGPAKLNQLRSYFMVDSK
jgi:competence ComEA-like helix-hairpin-helix protein